jgi:peptidoglycan/xylan/chitin deacetylase (PgdA/CDA1 family)
MRVVVIAALFVAAVPVFSNTARAASPGCANANALGVGRTVEIDTTGGPGFGFEHYKAFDFLQAKEVVLTFDDGPQKFATEGVLAALAAECTKATFFTIGKMALGYPEILRLVATGGHTIGTHTWSHKAIAKLKTFEEGRDEIERGVSAVRRAAGVPISPFFRFPTLRDTPEAVAHLGKRNMAMFSTDIDSFDFKLQPPDKLVQSVMEKLEKKGKGILLFHDIHKNTAHALPLLLTALKAKGYKVVHLTAKAPVETLAEFDALIEKDAKGLPQAGAERPTSSVVRTIDGDAPAEETQKPVAPAPGKSSEVTAPASAPQAAATAGSETSEESAAKLASEGAAASKQVAVVPAASPVTTVGAPGATASIAPLSENGEAASAQSSDKSLSEQAKDLWETWFGK